MIITIDGPSGTGKTTVAKRVADALHFAYFDTGAMYRALTWWILENKVPLNDLEGIEKSLDGFEFHVVEKHGKKHYFVGVHDVTRAIRDRSITQAVSTIAALKQVRSHLLSFQHRFAKGQNAVFEGRDLGSVVFPQAEFKIFLTADPKVRAERRLQEMANTQEVEELTHPQVLKEIMDRDEQDSTRDVAPLRSPPNAFTVDTTSLSLEQVVETLVKEYKKRFSLGDL